ncbi:MAG: D-sedoheptulose-7-phosphate isomerase [Kiritimatiellia bacterium]
MEDWTADRERLHAKIRASQDTIARLEGKVEAIAAVSEAIVAALRRGGTIFTAGNGGSAAEAMHMAEEFVARFRSNRRSLPAVALVADGTVLTCIANDFGYERVFGRQVEGLGRPGDVLVVFSTSGRSENILQALEAASRKGMVTVSILGRDGGLTAGRADYEIVIEADATEHIQEAHQVLIHLVLDQVEDAYRAEQTETA